MLPYKISNIDAADIDEQHYVFAYHLFLLVQDLINFKIVFWGGGGTLCTV